MFQIFKRTEPNGPDAVAELVLIGPEVEEADEIVSCVQQNLPDCDTWFEYYVEDRWIDEDGWQDTESIPLEDFMEEWEDTNEVPGLESFDA